MKNLRYPVLLVVLLALSGWAKLNEYRNRPPAVAGTPFAHPEHHYSFVVPEGWAVDPEARDQAAAPEFQPDKSPPDVVLVTAGAPKAAPTVSVHFSGPSDSQLQLALKHGLGRYDNLVGLIMGLYPGEEGTLGINDPRLDPTHNLLTYQVVFHKPDGDYERSEAFILGRNGLAEVRLSGPPDRPLSAEARADFDRVVATFRFDPKSRYGPDNLPINPGLFCVLALGFALWWIRASK